MQSTRAFALLASVPKQHLLSGQAAIAAQFDADDLPSDHHPKVAFGSMDFEVLGEVEKLRNGQAVEVFIHATNTQDQPLNPQVTWRGLYVGYVASRRGRYPGKSMYRPESTANDSPTWAVFWEVQELEPLKQPIAIGSLRGKNKKTNLQARYIPEGLVLIEYL